MSPTILRDGGLRYYFWSDEQQDRRGGARTAEPPHIHVRRAGGRSGPKAEAKLWLDPVAWAFRRGFTVAERRRIMRTVTAHANAFRAAYAAYHHPAPPRD